ncbi:hypothetical protein EVAR_22111_1 [Eumeta japonica]|uniref:Uncharacterized protein n=1 Tax=Eumeta variegata TaxID=151549 RepID=A0A4C1W279_EUMVA|nr:hypothetical protein EVAR_22111_1 [Eumeta japonica]
MSVPPSVRSYVTVYAQVHKTCTYSTNVECTSGASGSWPIVERDCRICSISRAAFIPRARTMPMALDRPARIQRPLYGPTYRRSERWRCAPGANTMENFIQTRPRALRIGGCERCCRCLHYGRILRSLKFTSHRPHDPIPSPLRRAADQSIRRLPDAHTTAVADSRSRSEKALLRRERATRNLLRQRTEKRNRIVHALE